jgi:hypothetical protein
MKIFKDNSGVYTEEALAVLEDVFGMRIHFGRMDIFVQQ